MSRRYLLSAVFVLAGFLARAVVPVDSRDSAVSVSSSPPENYSLSFLHTNPFIYDRILSPFQFDSVCWNKAGDFRLTATTFDPHLNRQLFIPPLDTHFAASNLRILLGSTREQMVFLDHAQHITKILSARIHYHSVVSPGFLLNCLSVHRDFGVSLAFQPRWLRSSLSFRYAKVEADENGGVADSLSIDKLKRSDFEQLKTRASDEKRKLRQYHLVWENFIPLFHRDSTGVTAGLLLNLDWYRYSTSYTGIGENNLYDQFYIDSAATNDTVGFNELRYATGVRLEKTKGSLTWMVAGGARLHDHLKWRILDSSSVFSFVSPFADVMLNWKEYFLSVNANQVISERANDGDFSADVMLSWRGKSKWLSGLSLELNTARLAPYLTSTYYRSNHFQWDNDFVKEEFTRSTLSASFFGNQISVAGRSYVINHMVFYNAEAVPEQNKKSVHLLQTELSGRFRWKRWSVMLMGRNSAVDASFIKIPEFSGLLRLSYTARYFKKALQAEFGTTVYGTTAYKGYAYMPATSVFYSQNEQTCGGWPVMDVFVNAGIGKATLSLSYQRFNSLFSSGEYFIAAGYPGAPSTIKFSVNWPLVN